MGDMIPLSYDSAGNLALQYDSNSGAVYYADGAPLTSNGYQGYYGSSGISYPGAPVSVDIPAGVSSESWLDLLTKAAPAVVNGINQLQLQQINVQRARAGLAPLNAATYAVGASGFQANSMNTLLYGGLALVALMLVSAKK